MVVAWKRNLHQTRRGFFLEENTSGVMARGKSERGLYAGRWFTRFFISSWRKWQLFPVDTVSRQSHFSLSETESVESQFPLKPPPLSCRKTNCGYADMQSTLDCAGWKTTAVENWIKIQYSVTNGEKVFFCSTNSKKQQFDIQTWKKITDIDQAAAGSHVRSQTMW